MYSNAIFVHTRVSFRIYAAKLLLLLLVVLHGAGSHISMILFFCLLCSLHTRDSMATQQRTESRWRKCLALSHDCLEVVCCVCMCVRICVCVGEQNAISREKNQWRKCLFLCCEVVSGAAGLLRIAHIISTYWIQFKYIQTHTCMWNDSIETGWQICTTYT